MEPSGRNTNLSATTTAVILLLVVVAAEMGSVGATRAACSYQSRTYPGWCINDHSCESICKAENQDNIGGACDGDPSLCYCQTPCPP
ncbi:hypothetical protein GQ55_6G272500 [Panicum hallii var. hallii]|uniref:Knottins-like domain-containing protein n=1 Tax=Panicum hallii var. hallii TaxID=1504633 RepID=A0A2T7DA42_9POAL|nr:hypothetical protein GQ55_6G272500 [Panicum hallii var. hallii]